MTKSQKHKQQLQAARAGLKLFYENSLILTSYEDLQNYLNNFASYFQQIENDKAPNKNIILFKTFLQEESLKSQEVKQIKRKSTIRRTKKKMNFKDYLTDYQILKNKGLSYRAIARHSEKYYKCKVSKDTLRKYLKDEEF